MTETAPNQNPTEQTPEQNPQTAPEQQSTQPLEMPLSPPPQERKPQPRRSMGAVLAAILLIGLIGGGLIGYSLSYATFNGRINDLQTQLQNLPPSNNTYVSYPSTIYSLGGNVSLASIYQQVRPSVAIIQGLVPQYSFFGYLVGYATQQGSGFVTVVNGQSVVVTNNHVMENTINVTVTFANGDSYPATLLGSDPQADLAVLKVSAASADLPPLTIVSSSTLHVGDPVVAVGSPYGLSGTLTTGVVSALGRTITESSSSQQGGPTIPDVIQTSTAINPGNSGGPLLDYEGQVVGITTAGVSNSEGLGFAIPSETILREISSLVSSGSYKQHPTIGTTGADMNYQIAQAIGSPVTYGYLVEAVSSQNGLRGGTNQVTVLGSQITAGGDIIVGINGTRITNTDDVLSYLEQHTLPGQTVDFNVVRGGQIQTIAVTIGRLS